MPDLTMCFDDPPTIHKSNVCLAALSKNVKGKLALTSADERKCEKTPCRTLNTVHVLKVSVSVHDCDSKTARPFNGTLAVARLVTIFDEDGLHRGFHAGDFEWTGTTGVVVKGRMSGVTNVGTHRAPVFKECQRCDERGVMEGRLCGQVVSAKDAALKGCHVVAAYRIRFDPSKGATSTAVAGVIEGVIICPCKDK